MSIKNAVGSGLVHFQYQGHSPPPWPVQMWYEMVTVTASIDNKLASSTYTLQLCPLLQFSFFFLGSQFKLFILYVLTLNVCIATYVSEISFPPVLVDMIKDTDPI